jgi:imidazolonepropionase-like amidohydrolase
MWLKGGQYYDVHAERFVAGDILIEDTRVKEIGHAPTRTPESIDLDGAFLLPGFFDCHVHLCVDTGSPDSNNPWRDALPGTIAIFAAQAARKTLMCGITTARDVGGWDYHEIAVREAIDAGWIPGPRLSCSGRILTITSSTTPYYIGMYEEADGPDAVRHAVRKQLAHGANFIKLLATGAVTSTKYERADAIQYRRDEIAAAVEIARDNFTYVAAHAHALEGIRNAVACGCRTIEHGSFADEEVFREMAAADCWLVPTLCTGPAMFRDSAFSSRVPPHIRERYQEWQKTRNGNMAIARKCGVKVAMGTDVGTPGNHAGDNMQELEVMVSEAKFPPQEAIRSATIEAARMMRLDKDLGTIEPGKLADVIAVPSNPLGDISSMRRVFFVMKEGRVYRNDRVPLSLQ